VMPFGQSRGNEDNPTPSRTVTFVRIGISLIVLGAALYVILSQNFTDESSKWAFGIVGIVLGYWLR
jgi:hypothetical protein